MSQPAFAWLSRSAVPPGRWDLRPLGWTLEPCLSDSPASARLPPVVLDWRSGHRVAEWRRFREPALVLAIGVDDPKTRAALIGTGFGDALPGSVALVELAARLHKLDMLAPRQPRQRLAGPLTLDFVHRDARLGDQWLALHPRDFALLWLLAEPPGARTDETPLMVPAWQTGSVLQADSLAVRAARLRSRLACLGLAWLIETCPGGGYRLGREGGASFAAFSCARREALDSVRVMGNGGGARIHR